MDNDEPEIDPIVGLAHVKKLWREHRSVIRQLEAAGIEPQPVCVGFSPDEPLTDSRMREIRRRIQAWRHLLRPPAALAPAAAGLPRLDGLPETGSADPGQR